jgi:hypothetical protein
LTLVAFAAFRLFWFADFFVAVILLISFHFLVWAQSLLISAPSTYSHYGTRHHRTASLFSKTFGRQITGSKGGDSEIATPFGRARRPLS